MAGPYRFFKPAEVDQTGWDAGANRQTIGVGRVAEVALSGQDVVTIDVQPSDASVTHVDRLAEVVDDECSFRLTGTKLGDAKLEAKDGGGAVVASMEVRVTQPPPTVGPPVSGAPRTGGQGANNSTTALRTSPWPAPYTTFSQDTRLQKALDAAMATEPARYQTMPTAIVALNADGTRPLAHHRGDEVHYAASMLKIAALYAAFELRTTLRSIADELGGSVRQNEVLQQVAAYLDPKIKAWVATVVNTAPPLAGAAAGHVLPRYASMFDVVPKPGVPGFKVEFSPRYKAAMEGAMGPSSNEPAATCVQGVGYGYLNGALASAGFFDPGKKNGIWLAGDFREARPGSKAIKYPTYRIPCVNDVDTAQGATALQFTRLMALVADRALINNEASNEMLGLLRLPPPGERYSEKGASANFEITNVKIGFGTLHSTKGGYPINSEAALVRHKTDPYRRFAICWLNLGDGLPMDSISSRLARTFDNYKYP